MPRHSAQPQKQQKQKSTRRHDPRPRPLNRLTAGAGLENTREGWHYVWASPGDVFSGLQHYLSMGYEVQRYEVGGVKPVTSTFGQDGSSIEPGSDITFMDMVLVGIDGEAHEDAVQYGAYGDGGQAMWDEIENRLLKKGGDDRLRGMHQLGNVSPSVARFEADPEHGIPGRE